MFTSVTNTSKERSRYIAGYCIATVFCFLFQLIYEYFSHGVRSGYMIYAFLIPLFGGIICVASFYLISSFEIPESTISGSSRGYIFRQLITGATIWLTLGSLFKGVLDIYGTSNKLTIVFLIVGSGHILVAIPQCKIRG